MGKMSKDKGKRFERQVASLLRDYGYPAQYMLEMLKEYLMFISNVSTRKGCAFTTGYPRVLLTLRRRAKATSLL